MPRTVSRVRPMTTETYESPSSVEEDTPTQAHKGWGAFKETKASTGGFPEKLTVTEEQKLVKFLEPEPFHVYKQHWVNNPPGDERRKSWVCANTDCALCDIGHRPRVLALFNVVEFSDKGVAENRIWEVGVQVGGQLEALDNGKNSTPPTGPLDRFYYGVSKVVSADKKKTTYSIHPVKERDVTEDWGIKPLTDEELSVLRAKGYGAETVKNDSRSKLKELAEAMAGESD